MFIKSMRIRNGKTSKVMREIPFHMGTNLIVDAKDSSGHNKVGKTTFLKLIDILMGAKDKKGVYTDIDTKTETTDLRNTIENDRISVEMTLVKNLESPECTETTELRVELFNGGKYFIKGIKLSYNDYCRELDKLLFGINDSVPSFRQLINSFVRVSVGGDDQAFLHTIPRGTHLTHRSVYDFLFNIEDPHIAKNYDSLKKQKSRVKESLKQYKNVVGNAKSIDEQRQLLSSLESEYKRIKSRADDIFDSKKYKDNRDKILKTRSEYMELETKINDINYKIHRNESTIKSTSDDSAHQANLTLTRNFFDEVAGMLPEINKTFEDMVLFNNQLYENKIKYFEEVHNSLLEQRTAIMAKKNNLLSHNQEFLSLIAEDRIDEYENLTTKLMKLKEEIGKTQEVLDTLKRYKDKLDEIESKPGVYSGSESGFKDTEPPYEKMMTIFNELFTPLAEKISGENPILIYQPNFSKFPLEITNLDGTSTGTRKSLIVAFDLAYQCFAEKCNIHTPKFVVHDVVESVEGKHLKTVVDSADEINAQYIMAVLTEKLESSEISKEKQEQLQILRLSNNDRLFDGVTVERNLAN